MRSWICDYRLICFSNTFWIRLQAWPEKKKKRRFLWFIFFPWGLNITVWAWVISSMQFLSHGTDNASDRHRCGTDMPRKHIQEKSIKHLHLERDFFETHCHHLRHAWAFIMLTVKLLKAFLQVFVKENRRRLDFCCWACIREQTDGSFSPQVTVSNRQPSFTLYPTCVYTLGCKAGCFTERKPAEVTAKIKKTPE